MKATNILEKAAQHMRDRAATYDKPEGERSMGKTVAAFNAITGRDLTTAEGWLMLAVLKQVRAFHNPAVPHVDSLEDGPAYLALMAEEMLSGEPKNAVAPPAEPAQPVNSDRPKLVVGQVWKDREGREVRIVGMDKDGSARPFEGCNGFYYTPCGEIFTGGFEDDGDLIELIQDEHGWRPWKATKDSVCPVGLGVRVRIKTVVGAEFTNVAQEIRWNAARNLGESIFGNVVAYQIIEEAQQ